MKAKTIAIDFDVYKMIITERESFEESPNEALRRLLGLPPSASCSQKPAADNGGVLEEQPPDENENTVPGRWLGSPDGISMAKSWSGVSATRGWSSKGVRLPHGTKLRATHDGERFDGEINEYGEWAINGRSYRTPSRALIEEIRKATGRVISLNGWIFWEVQRPGDERYIPLDSLRRGEVR